MIEVIARELEMVSGLGLAEHGNREQDEQRQHQLSVL
jgi:hypothetical protein